MNSNIHLWMNVLFIQTVFETYIDAVDAAEEYVKRYL